MLAKDDPLTRAGEVSDLYSVWRCCQDKRPEIQMLHTHTHILYTANVLSTHIATQRYNIFSKAATATVICRYTYY